MIDYLSHDGSDNSIANTARVSMQFGGEWDELPEDYSEAQRDRLISYLAKHKHTSPFRHNSVTIRIKVPIFIARQLGKHQVGMSWNEVSRRYVATEPEFFTPASWRSVPDGSIKQGSGDSVVTCMKDPIYCDYKGRPEFIYQQLIQDALAVYDSMLEAGIAPEQARMVLPQSMMTEVVWTGSIMAFAHVYRLRIDAHAQIEAQEFAKELDKIIRPLFPVSWSALVGEV